MVPSFQEIIRMALLSGVSAVEILTGTVSREGDAPGQTTVSFPGTMAGRNSHRSRMFFSGKRTPVVYGLGRLIPVGRLDMSGGRRSDEIRLAPLSGPGPGCFRKKRLLRASFFERGTAFENELFRMMKDVRERGIHPSLKLIETNITRRAKLRKDQKRFLWKGGAKEGEDSC